MIEKEIIIALLKDLGRWQRSAKNPSLTYSVSQMDTPLLKKRNVKPLFVNEQAEKLEHLMLRYVSKSDLIILELSYVDMKINTVSASILNCSEKTFTIKRNEVIAMLQGIYSVIRDYE